MTRLEREAFVEAARDASGQKNNGVMTGDDAIGWMAAQGE